MGNYAEWERCYSLAEEIKMKMPSKINRERFTKIPRCATLYLCLLAQPASLPEFRGLCKMGNLLKIGQAVTAAAVQ